MHYGPGEKWGIIKWISIVIYVLILLDFEVHVTQNLDGTRAPKKYLERFGTF